MQEVKIGIVEDEIIIADSIRSVLTGMHYTVPEPCCDYREAIIMLRAHQPDLVLLDINLGGSEQDGIAVARYIRDNMDMPFIFLTANSDAGTLTRAKTVTPNAFIVKPFQREDLYAAIEIALHNFYSTGNNTHANAARQYIFIKEGTQFHKVNFDDILYLKSDHVYVSVYTARRKYLYALPCNNTLEELDKKVFIRIHRGYVVNIHKVDNVDLTHLTVNDKPLPISRKYRDDLLKQL